MERLTFNDKLDALDSLSSSFSDSRAKKIIAEAPNDTIFLVSSFSDIVSRAILNAKRGFLEAYIHDSKMYVLDFSSQHLKQSLRTLAKDYKRHKCSSLTWVGYDFAENKIFFDALKQEIAK